MTNITHSHALGCYAVRMINPSHIIQNRRNRITGAHIAVIDARRDPGQNWQEDEGGRWVTWCDRHETFMQHETRSEATWQAADPTGWCGMCAEGME